VEKRYRNLGIGTTLVGAAARFFSSKGIRHVTLRNAIGNDLANEFWGRLTFNPVLYTRTATLASLEKALQKVRMA
jgi:ribosomal protein S18 acetylase RimI-like enzyme